MFTKNNWSDPQGMVFVLAIFQVVSADYSENSNTHFDYNRETQQGVDASDVNKHLNYKVVYWPSQEAYDSKLPPYTLVNPVDNGEIFTLNTFDASYNSLTVEAKAEQHILTII